MIARTVSAFLRAVLVAALVMTPSLLLPSVGLDTTQIVVVLAFLAAMMTFIEYFSRYPGIVEFRFAPPFNRVKFTALFLIVVVLSLICRGKSDPTDLTRVLTALGIGLGHAIDFPYSPVRLVVLMLPENAGAGLINSVRTAAGIAYMISLSAMLVFLTWVRLFGWPARHMAFNVWVNLPLFDPTAVGDVVGRLRRDAALNIVLGALLPFLIPVIVKAASDLIGPITMENPQSLIWTMTAWAFLPAAMIMRGIAMERVAAMIDEKRRRAYARAQDKTLRTA
ncbi:hypothetical protein [Roseovarius salinarum]|uniref:hypothetical protein n=1 Tax=Roseovarius salinarum TaxID=1981892 RepID=UPI001E4730F6|nr:hypothetical protein [Roseovarius salinarum]